MRSGFSLLEAVVATAILGLAAVAGLSALGAQVRSAERARATVLLEALAQDRLTRVRLASPDQLDRLPDSLARGELPPPWNGYRWEARSRRQRERLDLFDVSVSVTSSNARFELTSRLYRPSARARGARP